MDYYNRVKMAQRLVAKMLNEKFLDEEICLAVFDNFQLGKNWTTKYLAMKRGGSE